MSRSQQMDEILDVLIESGVSPKFPRRYSHVSPSTLCYDHGDAPLEVTAEGRGLGMTFGESPWETMEWLDLTPPSSSHTFHSGPPPSGPSIFNTEFLDVTDIGLNLEHW
ncbi:myocardin-like [Carassius carassius]|uniref:myocardin-like n=1 Tax=Carassius carassius TaxID=217509 RepID=UPI0028696609|nr:myocardin-like [Carassius carassius]